MRVDRRAPTRRERRALRRRATRSDRPLRADHRLRTALDRSAPHGHRRPAASCSARGRDCGLRRARGGRVGPRGGEPLLLPIALAPSQPHFSEFSGRSIFGFAYLVTVGSLIGYTAYVWLLDNAPLGKGATYAYVNPVVAIALGAIVLHESITWTIGVGARLGLASVGVVGR